MKGWLQKQKPQSLREMMKEYAWLSRYTLHYKAEVLWYILVGALGTAVSLGGSILSKHIIDAVTGFNSRGVIAALVFFLLMQLSQIAIRAISGRISAKVSIRVEQQITAQVYDTLLGADWEALSAYHSGDLLSRLTGDVSTVASSVLGWFPELFTRLLQFVGTLGVILYYDTTLALLALLSAPATLLMSRYAIKMMRQHSQRMRTLSSDMTVFNEESFQNIQLIKSFDRTEAYSEKHRLLQNEYKKATLDYNLFSIRKTAVMSLVGTLVAVLCFSWSAFLLWQKEITYGVMTLFLQLSGTLSGAFAALAGLIPGAIHAATAAGRIMTIMNLPPEEKGQEEAAREFIDRYGHTPLSVVAQAVSYHYESDEDVLSEGDLLAEAGQIVAVVGPSGEGKTTLLRLLLGIVRPKGGALEICAEDGARIPISPATRALFAYVPQGNTVFTGTIAENLRLTRPEATDQQLYEALAVACAEDFVRRLPLGLDTPIREQGGGFSEGQIQRLCIARAVLSDAPILLMDEATSALDTDTEQRVLHNLLHATRKRTCIITTHRPGVLKVSRRVYAIRQNRIEPMEG